MARSKTSNISFSAPTDPSPPPVFDDTESESELSPGRVLSQRYRLLKRLGSGGMGVVFHALDLDLNEDVALKVLLPELLRDKATAERFRNEVKLARKIAHSGVCRVFDVGEDGALRFLTMELIEGRTLRQLLSAEEIDGERAYSLLLQVADGLSAVHERGIVHRDLKPENVMVRPDGQTVLVDFGLARDSFLPGASSGGIAGTPRYMSPEQLRGGRLDVRSDVFSFGVMAFEMLSGRAPFGDGAVAEVATAILRDAPLRFERVGFSDARAQGLRVFFEKALAKAPEQRFGSAGELRSALEMAWATDSMSSIEMPKVMGIATREWRRRVLKWAIACSLVVGLAFALRPRWWEPTLPMVEVRPFRNLSDEARLDPLTDSVAKELRTGLRKSSNLMVKDPTAISIFQSPTWIVAGGVQHASIDGLLHLSMEIRETGESNRILIPLEIKAPSTEPARLLKNARLAVSDEMLRLAMNRERDRRAAEGTENKEARAKLLTFYRLMDREPTTLDKNAGKMLLDEVLEMDPNYVPALVERAYLLAEGIGVKMRSHGIDAGLRDLERALTLKPADLDASAMHCRVKRVEVMFKDQPSEEEFAMVKKECNAALARNPTSMEVRIALIHFDEYYCDNNRAIESLQGVLADIDNGLSPRRSLPRVLRQLIHLALEDNRMEIAETASNELVEFEDNKPNGIPASRGSHLFRGAVLMRMGQNNPQRLAEAKAEFIKELKYGNASQKEDWYEAGAIRGLMRIAAWEQTRIAPEYQDHLERIEQAAMAAVSGDPSHDSRLASVYQWTDPKMAVQWMKHLGPPKSFGHVLKLAKLHQMANQNDEARKVLSLHTPRQQWEVRCVDWMMGKLSH